jgi:DinB superfamily/Pentapeptide repeats (8 copies)
MPHSFEEADLSGSEFWGVDLSRASFRDVNFTNATFKSVWLVDVDIDGSVEHLTINGVDVTAYVNEHDVWHPLRGMIRPPDPDGMRAADRAFAEAWSATITRALRLPEEKLHVSVDGEWSFVQTLRHLVFAIDKWFTEPILGDPFHPIVLPNTGSDGGEWPGRDRDADPTVAEALAVFDERTARIREFLTTVNAADLTKDLDVRENGTVPLRECIYVVFEEEFEHNRYALRDLAQLE